ncbi:DNA topoisomerase IV, partial [Actinomadura adrarensis]
VTVSGSSSELPGTQLGAIKVADYADFPAKGRATGGVRSHRFLKGEDCLIMAWAGPTPLKAASPTGKPLLIDVEVGRRDGSGIKMTTAVAAFGGTLRPAAPPDPSATQPAPEE